VPGLMLSGQAALKPGPDYDSKIWLILPTEDSDSYSHPKFGATQNSEAEATLYFRLALYLSSSF